MEQGLYTAFLGMRARQRALDTVAGNIANASTAGFKAQRLLWQSITALDDAQAGSKAQQADSNSAGATQSTAQPILSNEGTPNNVATDARDARGLAVTTTGTTDFTSGAIRPTGRPLDVALAGDGFLTVQTARGERYTRAGSLTVDSAGQLVTQSGDLIIGQNGAITIPRSGSSSNGGNRGGGGELSISEDGSITFDNKTIDKLKLTRFANPQKALQQEGGLLFVATGGEPPQTDLTTRVEGGALESSNVEAMSEMVTMMQHNREFEALQKSISTMMNDLGRKVSSEIGRL